MINCEELDTLYNKTELLYLLDVLFDQNDGHDYLSSSMLTERIIIDGDDMDVTYSKTIPGRVRTHG